MIRITAPGKLMIAGEYSVLGPQGEALAVAVSPGLELEIAPAKQWQLHRDDTGERWSSGDALPEGLRFLHAALETVRARYNDDLEPQLLRTRLASTAIGTGTRKPGIGGSASACAAATAALLASLGRAHPDEICELAVRAHTRAQGGQGSGYDVATITYGGLVRWRPARLAGGGRGGEAQRIAWPRGLFTLAGYTGVSASTTGFLSRLEAMATVDRAAAVRDLITLGQPVGALVDAFVEGNVARILDALGDCHRALVHWDRIGVITEPVIEMIRLAESVGARAKVSGAGGGDSVLAFASSQATLAAVSDVWRASGFEPLSFRISDTGAVEKNLTSDA